LEEPGATEAAALNRLKMQLDVIGMHIVCLPDCRTLPEHSFPFWEVSRAGNSRIPIILRLDAVIPQCHMQFHEHN
jgi:hypothetical protein